MNFVVSLFVKFVFNTWLLNVVEMFGNAFENVKKKEMIIKMIKIELSFILNFFFFFKFTYFGLRYLLTFFFFVCVKINYNIYF